MTATPKVLALLALGGSLILLLTPLSSCSVSGIFDDVEGNGPFAAISLERSSPVASRALSWNGKHYRRGYTRQCANWVAHVVTSAGLKPPEGSAAARSWLGWGTRISPRQMKPGDVLVFQNTYRKGISHVGIYVGDGNFMHRSSRYKPILLTPIERYQVASVRRYTVGSRESKARIASAFLSPGYSIAMASMNSVRIPRIAASPSRKPEADS